jgi:hypothetical protein
MFRVYHKLIDLVSFELFLPDLEKVVGIYVTLTHGNVPYRNASPRVSNE